MVYNMSALSLFIVRRDICKNMEESQKTKLITKKTPLTRLPLYGINQLTPNSISVCVYRENVSSCYFNIYKNGRKAQAVRLFSLKNAGMSDVFCASLSGTDLISKLNGASYDFSAEGEHFVDHSARAISGRDSFGKKGRLRARFDFSDFDWSDERRKIIPYDEMVMCETHVRGFTRHSSSGVAHPGTFDGLKEKLPYLKKLGINTLFLLPIYDFDETAIEPGTDGKARLNYWGYSKSAYHFAPKASYCADPSSPRTEFMSLIKEIHRQGMNIILDMYFENCSTSYVLTCLRYYSFDYHIDGFRINPGAVDLSEVRKDEILSHVRFIYHSWEDRPDDKNSPMLFEMNDGFKNSARRYVKSDEGQVEGFYYQFRTQRNGVARINYITGHDGFTLRDLISYDVKHNEANGERGLDGTEYNYSWNCGFEGVTTRKAVLKMRKKQEKNILMMLLLGLPIPMLLSGDEFGNSQKGNNNAYCIDGPTTWLNWNLLEKNKETFSFIKKLLNLRKKLSIYHRAENYTGFDHKGYGAPDISSHGKEPWNNTFPYYSRELGILFYGPYLDETPKTSYYLAFNMHWESHNFYLPDITKKRDWRVVIDTARDSSDETGLSDDKTSYSVEARSVVLLSCREDPPAKPAKRKGTKRTKSSTEKANNNAKKTNS